VTDDEQAFAALTRRACPPVGEALFAVAAAWRPVDWQEMDGRLDQLARPLFGAGPGGRERAGALAELLVERFRPDPVLVDGLWLDRVLDSGRGHPVMLAAVATEVARRAGWSAMVCSSRQAWFAGLVASASGDEASGRGSGVLWLVDPTGEASGSSAPKTVRRHCAHELAFIVLSGLAERFAGPRDREQAQRLREQLDVSTP
jgi:Transglutaminase-like superfamily